VARVLPRAVAALACLTALLVSGGPAVVVAQPGGPSPGPTLPPLPPGDVPLPERDRLFVREIRVVGSTVFDAEALRRLTAPYTGREVTVEDLEALRVALTRLYVDLGYVNSGALLSEQVVADGVITYQIVEGGVSDIEVVGARWFRAGHLRRRLARATAAPLNVNALQEQIQILLDDPRLRRLNAELMPGLRPGESVLRVVVEEPLPYRLTLDVDNYQSPSVGAERGILVLEHLNLTGNGDVLSLQYGRSDGVDPLLDFAYAIPITAADTVLGFRYQRNTQGVVSQEFQVLGIESDSEIFSLSLRQPVYRTRATEVALAVALERSSHETTLLGEPFELVPGSDSGRTVVTALRLGQEWTTRTQDRVVAARSRFSVGLDGLGSTIHRGEDVPDSRFFAWLGQFQLVQRLPVLDAQLLVRSDVQLTGDRLLSLEQVAVGGRYSVRGYRENTQVRDSAALGSVEVRVPIVRNRPWADAVELAPFFDYGRGWDARGPRPDPRDLMSVGIGVRWGLTIPSVVPLRPQFEVYWGKALRHVETPGGDLQDHGLHFQFLLTVF
jgi:hemolysin activation/secretion protein